MESLWEQTWGRPGFPALKGDLSTGVLIIGGGMAGILCAYFLNRAGVPYVLVEAKTLCSGITRNTTAKITSQHRLIYGSLPLVGSGGHRTGKRGGGWKELRAFAGRHYPMPWRDSTGLPRTA